MQVAGAGHGNEGSPHGSAQTAEAPSGSSANVALAPSVARTQTYGRKVPKWFGSRISQWVPHGIVTEHVPPEPASPKPAELEYSFDTGVAAHADVPVELGSSSQATNGALAASRVSQCPLPAQDPSVTAAAKRSSLSTRVFMVLSLLKAPRLAKDALASETACPVRRIERPVVANLSRFNHGVAANGGVHLDRTGRRTPIQIHKVPIIAGFANGNMSIATYGIRADRRAGITVTSVAVIALLAGGNMTISTHG